MHSPRRTMSVKLTIPTTLPFSTSGVREREKRSKRRMPFLRGRSAGALAGRGSSRPDAMAPRSLSTWWPCLASLSKRANKTRLEEFAAEDRVLVDRLTRAHRLIV